MFRPPYDELEEDCDKLLEAGYVPFSLANGSKWTGSMYYMYLVARHSGNDEFAAAYTQARRRKRLYF